jgi:hypothetical protein
VETESGDFLFPLKEGRIEKTHFAGEIGDVLAGKIPGRTSETCITIFEALGLAAEDIACAAWLLENKQDYLRRIKYANAKKQTPCYRKIFSFQPHGNNRILCADSR